MHVDIKGQNSVPAGLDLWLKSDMQVMLCLWNWHFVQTWSSDIVTIETIVESILKYIGLLSLLFCYNILNLNKRIKQFRNVPCVQNLSHRSAFPTEPCVTSGIWGWSGQKPSARSRGLGEGTSTRQPGYQVSERCQCCEDISEQHIHGYVKNGMFQNVGLHASLHFCFMIWLTFIHNLFVNDRRKTPSLHYIRWLFLCHHTTGSVFMFMQILCT